MEAAEKAPWFIGPISTTNAEEILWQPHVLPGDFLIRKSKSLGGYCLVIMKEKINK